MTSEHRVRYNSANYGDAFSDNEDRSRLLASEREPSLFVLIEVTLFQFLHVTYLNEQCFKF